MEKVQGSSHDKCKGRRLHERPSEAGILGSRRYRLQLLKREEADVSKWNVLPCIKGWIPALFRNQQEAVGLCTTIIGREVQVITHQAFKTHKKLNAHSMILQVQKTRFKQINFEQTFSQEKRDKK